MTRACRDNCDRPLPPPGYSLVELVLFLIIAATTAVVAIQAAVRISGTGGGDTLALSHLRQARTLALITRCPVTLSLPGLEISIQHAESMPDDTLSRIEPGQCTEATGQAGLPGTGATTVSGDISWVDGPHSFLAHRMPAPGAPAEAARARLPGTGRDVGIDAVTEYVDP